MLFQWAKLQIWQWCQLMAIGIQHSKKQWDIKIHKDQIQTPLESIQKIQNCVIHQNSVNL